MNLAAYCGSCDPKDAFAQQFGRRPDHDPDSKGEHRRIGRVGWRFNLVALISLGLAALGATPATAQLIDAASTDVAAENREGSPRQRLDAAWWTGPLLAANAETLPTGHVYIEPYLFDVIADGKGTPGSLTYLLYGVAPRFTAGLLPCFSNSANSLGKRRLRAGDMTLDFQYRLTADNPKKAFPTIAFVIQERVPTAPFDRLKVSGSGAGAGDFATTLGLYAQQYLWMPNGRIVRARLNLSHTFESKAHVHGRSVYGTEQSFAGSARPGDSTVLDAAAEYSLTKRVVLALDLVQRWDRSTLIRGRDGSVTRSPELRSFALAPAVEYNWSPTQGVILGARWILKERNNRPSFTPVVAYSLFL